MVVLRFAVFKVGVLVVWVSCSWMVAAYIVFVCSSLTVGSVCCALFRWFVLDLGCGFSLLVVWAWLVGYVWCCCWVALFAASVCCWLLLGLD